MHKYVKFSDVSHPRCVSTAVRNLVY